MRHEDLSSLQAKATAARLGQRIREARKNRKLSLEQVERRCRIHRTTLARLERGDTKVSFNVLLSVLEVLGELREIDLLVTRPSEHASRPDSASPPLDTDF